MKLSGAPALALAAAAVVVAAVSIGLFIIGSPGEQRAIRLDERRVEDLRGISRSVDLYWTRQGSLPATFDEVAELLGAFDVPVDPETSMPYEYRILEGSSYQLCAGFSRESAGGGRRLTDPFWSHARGRQCFDMEAEEVER